MNSKPGWLICLISFFLAVSSVALGSMSSATVDFGPLSYDGASFTLVSGSGVYGNASGSVEPASGFYEEFGPDFAALNYTWEVAAGGSLTLSLPYEFTGSAITENPGDSAYARTYLVMDITTDIMTPEGETRTIQLARPDAVMEWFSNDGVAGSGQDDSGILTAELTDFTELTRVDLNLYGNVMGNAFTAETAVVPVPGAVLLGMLGLGAAGLRLRRYS